MYTTADIETALLLALRESFRRRCENPAGNWRLFYQAATKEHDGGLLILSEPPANPDWQPAPGGELDIGSDDNQNYNRLRLRVTPYLPILSNGSKAR